MKVHLEFSIICSNTAGFCFVPCGIYRLFLRGFTFTTELEDLSRILCVTCIAIKGGPVFKAIETVVKLLVLRDFVGVIFSPELHFRPRFCNGTEKFF